MSSFGSKGPSVIGLAGLDLVAVVDDRAGDCDGSRSVSSVPSSVTIGDRDGPCPRPRAMRTTPDAAGQAGRAARRAGLEQLDDAGQTAGDVLTGHTTGVEGPHRQLRAGLADGLGGDDADGLAELDRLAGGQRPAVAEGADAELGVAGEHRPHPDPVDRPGRRAARRPRRRRRSVLRRRAPCRRPASRRCSSARP